MAEIGAQFLAGIGGTILLMLLFLMVVVLWDIALALRDVAEKIDYLEDDVDSDLATINGTLTRIYDRMDGGSGGRGEQGGDTVRGMGPGPDTAGLGAGEDPTGPAVGPATSTTSAPVGAVRHADPGRGSGAVGGGVTAQSGGNGRREVASPPTAGAAAGDSVDAEESSGALDAPDADAHGADEPGDEHRSDVTGAEESDTAADADPSDADDAGTGEEVAGEDDAAGDTDATDQVDESVGQAVEDEKGSGSEDDVESDAAGESDPLADLESESVSETAAEVAAAADEAGVDALGDADSSDRGDDPGDVEEESSDLEDVAAGSTDSGASAAGGEASNEGRFESVADVDTPWYAIELERSADGDGFGMEDHGIGQPRSESAEDGANPETGRGPFGLERPGLRSQLEANANRHRDRGSADDGDERADGVESRDSSLEDRDASGGGTRARGSDDVDDVGPEEDLAQTTITDVATVPLDALRGGRTDGDSDDDAAPEATGGSSDELATGTDDEPTGSSGGAGEGALEDANDDATVDGDAGDATVDGDVGDATVDGDTGGATVDGDVGDATVDGDVGDATAVDADDTRDALTAEEILDAATTQSPGGEESPGAEDDDDGRDESADVDEEGDIAELVNRELDTLTEEVGGTSLTPDVSEESLEAAVDALDGGSYTFPLSGSEFAVQADVDTETATLQFTPADAIDLQGARERLLKYQLRNYLDRDETAHAELSTAGGTVILEIPAANGPAISAWADAAVQIIDRTLYLSKNEE